MEGIEPSGGSVGDAYGNALMETINRLYKAEFICSSIFHASSLGYVPPVEFEQSYYAALNRELQHN